MATLDKESILLLAPDSKSVKAAEGLASPSSWQTLGKTNDLLWGLFKGSAPQPYQTQIDLCKASFDCSCPSRKHPCKHGLALAMIHAENEVAQAAAPAWLNVAPSDSAPASVPEEPFPSLPESWQPYLAAEFDMPYMQELGTFLQKERNNGTVYPSHEQVFSALELTPYEQVKVLILGQDPYHGPIQAHGLSFSVQPGVPVPPSLRNIFKELNDGLGITLPDNGYLKPWAEQGVLMLNAVLTVRRGQANAHKDKGWELFTDTIIKAVNNKEERVVFVLWGNYAQKKRTLINESKHRVVVSAHPSPLSARNGFFGSRPFSQVNALLEEAGRKAVDWQLEALPF